MARRPEGFALTRDPRTGVHTVRFTHGRRYHLSTGERDPRKAQVEAARLYAEIVSGRRSAEQARRVGLALDALFAEWIVAMEAEVSTATVAMMRIHALTHLEPYFGETARITSASASDYMRARLRSVSRSTVKKELSSLRRFVAWASEQRFMDAVTIPHVPKASLGTPHPQGKRSTVLLTAAEVAALLAELPERTTKGLPARAFHTVMWETGLRKATLERLETPAHYRRGGSELVIADEIDKSRFGRVLDLSEPIRAALDSVCPDRPGVLFGVHDYRGPLRAAAARAGIEPHRVAALSNHDFRHSRITDFTERTKDLASIAYVAGHKHVTTTALYAHARREAAKDLLHSGHQVATGAMRRSKTGAGKNV